MQAIQRALGKAGSPSASEDNLPFPGTGFTAEAVAAHVETLKSRSRFIKYSRSNTSLRIKILTDLLSSIQRSDCPITCTREQGGGVGTT
jgi:hypothetical protein